MKSPLVRRDQLVQIVGCLVGKPRGGEDRSGVVLEELQPVRDIGGMVEAGLIADPQIGAQECSADLRYQLFRSEVAFRNAIAKATEPMPRTCPVNQLMQ